MIRKLLASTSILAAFGATALHADTFPEVEDLTLGFIKLTDMAPLAVAYERGYFEDEGLFVTLEAQANWKVLIDGVIDGNLHGADMLAGQPLAAMIGFGTEAHIVTPFVMDLNGNATTVSNEVWEQAQVLHADHMAERARKTEFLERQSARNAELVAAGQADRVRERPYTGSPTYCDQI